MASMRTFALASSTFRCNPFRQHLFGGLLDRIDVDGPLASSVIGCGRGFSLASLAKFGGSLQVVVKSHACGLYRFDLLHEFLFHIPVEDFMTIELSLFDFPKSRPAQEKLQQHRGQIMGHTSIASPGSKLTVKQSSSSFSVA